MGQISCDSVQQCASIQRSASVQRRKPYRMHASGRYDLLKQKPYDELDVLLKSVRLEIPASTNF